jgi:hypothetical protein
MSSWVPLVVERRHGLRQRAFTSEGAAPNVLAATRVEAAMTVAAALSEVATAIRERG